MKKALAAIAMMTLPTSILVGSVLMKNLPSVQLLDATQISVDAPVPCQEDEPCWNCHTMGNHICGSDLTAQADAAWEGLSMEDQKFLNSIGASDQTIIDFRNAQLAAVGLEGSWGIEVEPDTQEVLLVPVSPAAPHLGAELPHTL